MNHLKNFLWNKAVELTPQWNHWLVDTSYQEDVNPDALSDAWLDNDTSYIWKVGVLAVLDGNKRDWVHLFVGHHREPQEQCEFVGHFSWRDGENDDIARCLQRYLKCAQWADIIFLPDD
jgi:hypothetical protein